MNGINKIQKKKINEPSTFREARNTEFERKSGKTGRNPINQRFSQELIPETLDSPSNLRSLLESN